MIVTKPRPIQRLLENLSSVGAKRIAVMGCGGCATVGETGGEPQVSQLAQRLSDEGYEVVGTTVPESACNVGLVGLEIRRFEGVETAEAIIVLSCGSGVQVVSDALPTIPVFPGLDSMFLGNAVRHGIYEERCRLCGACGLDKTGGICIYTMCPKGLLNGPCGGMWDGRCEVLNDRECAHVSSYQRLKAQGRWSNRVRPAKNHSTELHPGSHSIRTDSDKGAR